MTLSFKCLAIALLMSIAAGFAAEKERPKFTAGSVTDYSNRQTVEKVTSAAKVFTTEEQAKAAFGKLNPYRHGILPVLVILQNDTGQTISLERMRVMYITPENKQVEATPAADVRFINAPDRPGVVTGPGGRPRVVRTKNPLNTWEIEGRAFAARMLPSGDSASGFFYFQTPHRQGSSVVITGLREAVSGRELFFFEIPLDQ